jgi:hypothetical protein
MCKEQRIPKISAGPRQDKAEEHLFWEHPIPRALPDIKHWQKCPALCRQTRNFFGQGALELYSKFVAGAFGKRKWMVYMMV